MKAVVAAAEKTCRPCTLTSPERYPISGSRGRMPKSSRGHALAAAQRYAKRVVWRSSPGKNACAHEPSRKKPGLVGFESKSRSATCPRGRHDHRRPEITK